MAANLFNDALDIEIDKINKPYRFLITYPVNLIYIYITIIMFFIVGSLLTYKLTSLSQSIVLFIVFPSLVLYEILLKRLPIIGNIIVSLLVGIVFIYAEASFVNRIDVSWRFFYLAFLLNLIREIIKDIEDIDGDVKNNFQTAPVILGLPKTIFLIRFLVIFFICTSLSPFYIYYFNKIYFPLILVTIHMPLLYIIWRLKENITSKECGVISKYLKFIIINGILILFFTQ